MAKLLIAQFGDPILRRAARNLTKKEIASKEVQGLIVDMREILLTKKLGVGLAAPQVGFDLALFVVSVRPTPHRPKVKEYDLVAINPVIIEYIGRRKGVWEGCLSAGAGGLFAVTWRYPSVKVRFLDGAGKSHEQVFKGLGAQIMQHETDHLNGILFMDKVKDTKSYMTLKEYKKYIIAYRKSSKDK